MLTYEAMHARQRWRAPLLLAAVLLLPVVSNRDAYRSYFDSDDLGTANWARFSPLTDYLRDVPNLIYPNGRPLGYFYYGVLLRSAGLHFPPWSIVLQCIGVVNVAMLWMLLRKLNFGVVEAALGCLFFGSGSALFDAWWRPAFIYDVLVTSFALLTLLAWIHRKGVLSFLAFWLAMRAKEIGIVLPAVLLGYEMILGERRWKRTLPFWIPAVVYGASGAWFSLHAPHSPYTLALGGMWPAAKFYASRLFGIRYAGFALLPLVLVIRDRRLYFALGAILCELGIYFLLPERVLSVYLYTAATTAAIVIAVLAVRYSRATILAVLLWAAWQYTLTRKQAATMLADAADRRAYAEAVQQAPDAPAYAYGEPPRSFGFFGGEYVIRIYHHPNAVFRIDDSALPADQTMTLLLWNTKSGSLSVAPFRADGTSFFAKGRPTEPWQADWPMDADGYRPLRQEVDVWMYRPANSPGFEVEACGSPGAELRPFFDGNPMPRFLFKRQECITRTAPVAARDARMIIANFRIPKGEVRIGSFGFHSAAEIVSP